MFHYGAALVGELAVLACELAGHLGVAMDGGVVLEALGLDGTSGEDSFAYDGAGFGGERLAEFGDGNWGDLDVEVDAVHERAADFVEVAADGARGAGAFDGGVVVVAAGAGVHGCDEHEGCGVFDGGLGAADGDAAFFHRLTQDFERSTLKFRQFDEADRLVPFVRCGLSV